MFSKREQEGYLLIDHRAGPGITPEMVTGTSLDLPFVAVPGGKMFESPTITCHHCERLVVLNPDRSRSRGYCPKCDHYVCDQCEAERVRTGVCKPFNEMVYELFDRAIARGE